jgi:pimeloyl-ACP methyl ester carboxylesterase
MFRRLTTAAIAAIALALPAFAQERFTATVSGQGSDVILIPGLGSSGAVWDATVKQLAPTHRVHVVQVSGFAGAPARANGGEGEMLPGLVAEIGAYAVTLDRPALIGHSLGGLIAMKVAAAQPEEISRVMIVDALPFLALLYNPSATAEQFRPQAVMMRNSLLASEQGYAMSARMSVRTMVKTDAEHERVLKWALDSDHAVFAKAMFEDAVDDARLVLPKITAKMTVVYAYDPDMPYPKAAVDEMYARAYAGLARAKLVRIDASYHFIQIDQPARFAKEVEAFLK